MRKGAATLLASLTALAVSTALVPAKKGRGPESRGKAGFVILSFLRAKS